MSTQPRATRGPHEQDSPAIERALRSVSDPESNLACSARTWIDPPRATPEGFAVPRRRPLFNRVLEATLASYVDRMLAGTIELWQLPYPINDLAQCAWDLGASEKEEIRHQLEQANADADRYYAEMCRRPPAPTKHLEQQSLAEISRIRGEHRIAARADEASRERHGDLT